MSANLVKQQSSTTGTGAILLDINVDSFITFSSVVGNNEQVYYSIQDGDNREVGLGTYTSGSNTLTRTHLFETLVNGTHTRPGITPITLSGAAYISLTPTIEGLTTHTSIWKSLKGEASTIGYTTPAGATLINGIMVPGFNDVGGESIGYTFAVGNDIEVGSLLYPFIQWSPSTTSGGDVRWGLELTYADAISETFTATNTIYITQTASTNAKQHQLVEFDPGDAITAKSPNSLLTARLFRDSSNPADTFTGDALIINVGLHYLADRVGTPKRSGDYYDWS